MSDPILQQNINYWNWWVQHENTNIVSVWNVSVQNWQSNYGQPNSSATPPAKPLVWAFDSSVFTTNWQAGIYSDNPSTPTNPSAFSQHTANVPDPLPPAAYIPPGVLPPPTLGPVFPNDPTKFSKAPGDMTQPGYLLKTGGHSYVLVGAATPFGSEDYWQQIN